MENISLKVIGERLQAKRKELHITQQELADHVNITTFFISKIENGKTNSLSIAVLREICNYLDLDMSDILRGTNPQGTEYLSDDIGSRLKKLDATQREMVVDIIDAIIHHTK